jgi:plastocyanin
MTHTGTRIAKEKMMRIVLGLFVIMTATFFSTSMPVPDSRAQSSENNGGLQVIEVTTKKYEFSPSPIRVKQGTRVQLTITATDRAHGFKIKAYPEGTHPTDSPGLIFSSAQSCERIEKHQTTTIEFVRKLRVRTPSSAVPFAVGVTDP